MSDNKKSNESVDRFSEYVRQRLKTHPTQPDENCWDEIEARLPKKRKLNPVWFGISVAASILITVVILHQPDKKSTQEIIQEITDISTYPIDINEPIDKQNNIIAETQTKKTVKYQSPFIAIESQTAMKKMEEEETKPVPSEEVAKNENQHTEETNETSKKQKTTQPYQITENQSNYRLAKKRRSVNDNWQISAGFSSGSSFGSFFASADNNHPDYYYDDSNTLPEFGLGNDWFGAGKEDESINTDDIRDINHSAPISFGITARKRFNNTWSIESGLVYTYLSSDFKIESNYNYDATLSLHYLGIPVNLIANIWENKHWNVYLSGGGMVEKGLRSVYKQNIYSKNSISQSKQENNISGLQWSLNGAIGVSYNLYKDINLYVEPGISYFFDCNQPLSKRTEDPTNFNIRIGIRYNLK